MLMRKSLEDKKMSLNDIINVTISSSTAAATRTGFGIPLIAAYHTYYTDRVRQYATIDAMVTDGFVAGEPAYRAASAVFSQSPKVNYVLIGRTANDQEQLIKVTPVAVDSTDYVISINGSAATFTSDGTATVAEICTGLKTQIDLLVEPVAVVDNTTDITIEASVAGVDFNLYIADRSLMSQENSTPDLGGANGIAADLAAIRLINDDWYWYLGTNQGTAVITAAAVYIETQKKVYVLASAEDDIYSSGSTTDIAYVLSNAGYARSMSMYQARALEQYPDAAWVGKVAPLPVGSYTCAYKTLSGVSPTVLTETEKTNIIAKNCNYYYTEAGVNTTYNGVSTDSATSFLDLVIGVDYITSRMQENIFTLLVNNNKIPGNDTGITMVENEIRGVLSDGVTKTIIEPGFKIKVPLASEIDASDKANRILPDMRFEAVFTGAYHKVLVIGVITI